MENEREMASNAKTNKNNKQFTKERSEQCATCPDVWKNVVGCEDCRQVFRNACIRYNYRQQNKKYSEPKHGLMKIPDEVIMKELRVEIGKLHSYIDELQHELKATKGELKSYKGTTKRERKKLRSLDQENAEIRELGYQVENWKHKYEKLKKDYDMIFQKYVNLQREHMDKKS